MFGRLDRFMKRINDQIAEYATVQADIARRLCGPWLAPMQIRQPVPVMIERHAGRRPHRF